MLRLPECSHRYLYVFAVLVLINITCMWLWSDIGRIQSIIQDEPSIRASVSFAAQAPALAAIKPTAVSVQAPVAAERPSSSAWPSSGLVSGEGGSGNAQAKYDGVSELTAMPPMSLTVGDNSQATSIRSLTVGDNSQATSIRIATRTHLSSRISNITGHHSRLSCSDLVYPDVQHIVYDNLYWQGLNYSTSQVLHWHLYSAYYDNRILMKKHPVIRINGVLRKNNNVYKSVTYCQIWYENDTKYVITQVPINYRPKRNGLGTYYQQWIITCPMPIDFPNDIVPTSISLVEEPCGTPRNILKVIYNLPADGIKKDIAICIKSLNYPGIDLSLFMVEWIELNFLLGVDKISFHILDVHPNVSKVLNYYESLGKVQLTPITVPGENPNKWVRSKVGEKLPQHDCFYSNMNNFKYIAIQDFDEVFFPKNASDLKSFISNKKGKNKYPNLQFEIITVVDTMRQSHDWNPDIPSYMYLLKNIYRGKHSHGPKTMLDTESVVAFGCHFPIVCLKGRCRFRQMHDKGALFHYRSGCKWGPGKCHEARSIKDTRIWKYQDRLIEQTTFALKRLQLI